MIFMSFLCSQICALIIKLEVLSVATTCITKHSIIATMKVAMKLAKHLLPVSISYTYSNLEISVLKRSYGAPNGARRYSVAQCHDKTWATLVQSKVGLQLFGYNTLHCYNIITHSETKLYCTINNYIGSASYSLN